MGDYLSAILGPSAPYLSLVDGSKQKKSARETGRQNSPSQPRNEALYPDELVLTDRGVSAQAKQAAAVSLACGAAVVSPEFLIKGVAGLLCGGLVMAGCGESINTSSQEWSDACENSIDPKYPYKGVNPTNPDDPALSLETVDEAQLKSDAGVILTWEWESTNCDDTLDQHYYVVNFPDGAETVWPDPATGKFKVEHTFKKALPTTQQIGVDIHYYNPNDSAALVKANILLLNIPDLKPMEESACYYSTTPAFDGNIYLPAEITSNNLSLGDQVRLSIKAHECDYTSDNLVVEFLIDGLWIPAQKDETEEGTFFLDHTFTMVGAHSITAHLKDTTEGRGDDYIPLGTGKDLTFYVSDPSVSSEVKLYARSDYDFVAFRPIELSATYVGTDDGLTYQWEIIAPNEQPLSGLENNKVLSFTPEEPGNYTVTVNVFQPGIDQPIASQMDVITVWPFVAPNLVITGNQYPEPGSAVTYGHRLEASERPYMTEDAEAICYRTFGSINPETEKTTIFLNNAPQNCQNDGYTFTFPTVATQTHYFFTVSVIGGNNTYNIPAQTYPITLYP